MVLHYIDLFHNVWRYEKLGSRVLPMLANQKKYLLELL